MVAAVMIGPRLNRWNKPENYGVISPVTALTGTLLLWWAWFSFNCGSTLGSTGNLWKLNALIAVNTLNGSVGGTCFAIAISMLCKKGRVDVTWLINGILGGLVSITGVCSVTSPLECIFIGGMGGLIAIVTSPLMGYLKIDDPVGAVPVHCFAAIWGTLSVGIFGTDDQDGTLGGLNGLLHGGGFYLLGVQLLGMVAIYSWSGVTTAIFLVAIDKTIGLRMSKEHEEAGADLIEHGIRREEGLRGIGPTEDNDFETMVRDAVAKHSMFIPKQMMSLRSMDEDGTIQKEKEEKDRKATAKKRPSIFRMSLKKRLPTPVLPNEAKEAWGTNSPDTAVTQVNGAS